MIYLMKVWCDTDNKWEWVNADADPTKCPTNDLHSIDTNKTHIVEEDIKVRNGHPSEMSLANYKQLRYNEIDWKTEQLILQGFTYDSQQFSLSAYAQTNWSSLKANVNDYTWPVAITTLDNDEYSLAEANLVAFWTAARDAVKGHLDSGRALKKTVHDAVDEAGVDAVVDTR